MGVLPREEGGCIWVSVRSSGGHRTLSEASPPPDVALTLQKRAAAGPSAPQPLFGCARAAFPRGPVQLAGPKPRQRRPWCLGPVRLSFGKCSRTLLHVRSVLGSEPRGGLAPRMTDPDIPGRDEHIE